MKTAHQPSRVCVLSIAGSDSGGGAGIQADLATCAAHHVVGATAITAITVQNTLGVQCVEILSPELVAGQARAVLEDLPVRAIKTGMLATAATVGAVAGVLEAFASIPLVIDPVICSSSGTALLDEPGVAELIGLLLPRAQVVTPNRAEAARLLGAAACPPTEEALERLARLAPAAAIVLTGGDVVGAESVDCVRLPDGTRVDLRAPRVPGSATHGTGCTFSAAIAAQLALGLDVPDAISRAKAYITGALAHAAPMGAGRGPLRHDWQRL